MVKEGRGVDGPAEGTLFSEAAIGDQHVDPAPAPQYPPEDSLLARTLRCGIIRSGETVARNRLKGKRMERLLPFLKKHFRDADAYLAGVTGDIFPAWRSSKSRRVCPLCLGEYCLGTGKNIIVLNTCTGREDEIE